MGILFRYIFLEIAVSTLIGTLLFTFVLFLQSVGPVMALLIGPNVPAREVLYIFLLMVPQTLRFTIPMGVLVGILVGFGRMSTDGEITAMRAAGIPGRKVILPTTLWTALGGVVCAATTLFINPWAGREFKSIQESMKISQATAEVQPRIFIEQSFPDRVLFVRDVIPGRIVHWKGVFIADNRSPELRGSFGGVNTDIDGPTIMVASEATAVPRPEQNRVQLSLSNAIRYEQTKDPNLYNFQGSAKTDQVLETDQRAPAIGGHSFDHMDTDELAAEARSGEKRVEALIELHQRFSFPIACLTLPMVGIPLAISSHRFGRSVGIVFGVVLVFIYWMIWLGGVAMASEQIVPVAPAIWLANGVFTFAGGLMLSQLDAPNRRDFAAVILGRVRDLLGRFRSNGDEGEETVEPGAQSSGLGGQQPHSGDPSEAGPSVPFFPIVDRYVLRTFLYYFAILVAVFVLIWFVFSFFELLSDMLSRGKLGLFIPYIYYLTPFLIYETAPLGVLVATLVAFGILSKHHEVTAFKACGVSLYRLARPILFASIAFSGALFFLDHRYLPETNRKQDAIRDEIKGRPVRTFLRPDRQWTSGEGDRIFYHRFFDSENSVLAGVNVYDFDSDTFQLRRHISAERARWEPQENAWVFESGWVRQIRGEEVTSLETFDARTFPDLVEAPDHFLKEVREHQQMNWGELRTYIAELAAGGFDTIQLQVELHKKLAFPLFAFVMAILAVPFSMMAGHRGALAGVALSIGLAVVYYSVDRLFEQLGNATQLSPWIAAWSPSVIFGLSGAYLFARVRS